MKKDLIIWGATGQCIVLEEFLSLNYNIIALFDKNKSIASPFTNVPIYNDEAKFLNFIQQKKNLHFIVAIGGEFGKIRIEVSNKLEDLGLKVINAIHPEANIANNVITGKGVQILISATIATRANIGDYCIVNSSASIDHECNIKEGVHIAPGATLAGCVIVGENSFVGSGAIILPRLKIGANSIIGAGAVVTKDIPPYSVAIGNPAKVTRTLEPINIDGTW